jgi:hypothetical protein
LRDAQPNSLVFFLDKNHGLLIRDMLRRVEVNAVAHKDMGWRHDMKDVEIIDQCAARNFIILSGDKSMERVPEERQAIINGGCKVFMFADSDRTRTEDWVSSVLIGRERMFEIVTKTRGPLFVTIKPCRVRGHIGAVDFISKAGGGWLAEGEAATVTVPAIEHLPGNMKPPKEQQSKFPWVSQPKE